MRFNIRDVLWLTAVVACLICWYLERDGRLQTSQRYLGAFEARKRLEAELAESRAAHVEANRKLEQISAERYRELLQEVEQLERALQTPAGSAAPRAPH